MTRPGPPARPTVRNDSWPTDSTRGNNIQRSTPSDPRVMLSAGQPVGCVDYEDFCFAMTTPVLRDISSPSSGYEFPPMVFHEPQLESSQSHDFTEPVYTYLPSALSTLASVHAPAEPQPFLRDSLCVTPAIIEDVQLSAPHTHLDADLASAAMWDWSMVPSAVTTNSAPTASSLPDLTEAYHLDDYTTESPRSPFDYWTSALSAPTPRDAISITLRDIHVTPLPRHIKHWVSFFSGGLVPLLEGHLKTGGTVGTFSGRCDSPDALAILDQRLLALHDTYPLGLPRSAISRWRERLPNSVLSTSFLSWTALPPVTFLEAGQCYPPDNYETLHCTLKHIQFLANTQMTYPTYLIEGGDEDETHPDIIGALGSPLRIKPTSLGSTSTRNTILWINFGRQ
jgi:hypothetical protein